MKKLIAIISALSIMTCVGCSDKKEKDESSSESISSGEISDSGEAVQDNAPAVTDKAKSSTGAAAANDSSTDKKTTDSKSSTKTESGNSAAENGSGTVSSSEGTGSFKPDKFLEVSDFTDVNMNLNITDCDSASNIQKLELDLSAFGEGTTGNTAFNGESLWIFYMVYQGAEILRYDLATGNLTCVGEYTMDEDVIPVDVYFGSGKLLCNLMKPGGMDLIGIGEIDQATGKVTQISGSECGHLTYACDDTVNLIDVNWETESGKDSNDIPAKVYSLDPSTGKTELLFDGAYDEWCVDYPGKKAHITRETERNDEVVKTTLETDTYKVSPDVNCQLAGATSECASFLEYVSFSSDVTKRIHTYDMRTREHLIINATSIPEMYFAAGNNLVCYDPQGLIKTVYCVCPRIGSAFRLDGLSFLDSTPVISVSKGRAAVGTYVDIIGDNTTAVYYIIS